MAKHQDKSFPLEKGVKNIFTRNEVLELFSITPPTLRVWQRKNLINGTKIGRRVYFTSSEIHALFNIKNLNNGE